MHVLDNPIWSALTTRQSALGVHHPPASKFHADISLLGGFAEENYSAMAELVAVGEQVGIFTDEPGATPGFELEASAPLLQMVYAGSTVAAPPTAVPIVALTAADVPEMLALSELTKPGPVAARTYEMGDFVGIRDDGRLVAMAGQRLRVPGHIELSGICTHPDFLGRGYAAALTHWQVCRIIEAGEQPFLHVRGDNARAIALYERLGFAPRLRSRYVIVRRSA